MDNGTGAEYTEVFLGPHLHTVCNPLGSPRFDKHGLFHSTDMNAPYIFENQATVLMEAFGAMFLVLFPQIDAESLYAYTRFHEAARSDFDQAGPQNWSFWYGNVRAGNVFINKYWTMVERWLYDYAVHTGKEFKTIKGAHGQLHLNGQSGTPVLVDLSPGGKLHIAPHAFYVIVLVEKQAIVFYLLNIHPNNIKHAGKYGQPLCKSVRDQFPTFPWDEADRRSMRGAIIGACALDNFYPILENKPHLDMPHTDYTLLQVN